MASIRVCCRVVARDGSLRVWQYHNMLDNDADEPYVLGHAQDITEQRKYEEQLREQSTIDPLTGCRNRRFLDEHTAALRKAKWGCILIDLDRFKQINDTYGHERGDQVLIGMAEFLQQARAEGFCRRAHGRRRIPAAGRCRE